MSKMLNKYSNNRVYVEEIMKLGGFDLFGAPIHEEAFFLTPLAGVKMSTRVADEVSKRIKTRSVDVPNGKKFSKEFYIFTAEELESLLQEVGK